MTINQRNLTNFDENVIYDNTLLSKGEDGQCINCHSYQNYYKTGNMQFHVRQKYGGTMIITENQAKKVNLKTDYTISGGVYPAWHPTEKVIAYSVNDTHQSFHTKDKQKIEVMDKESSLILYDIEKNEVTDIVNNPDCLETFPSWSADGKFLYYVSASYPEGTSGTTENVLRYEEFRYDLYRKSFDPVTRTFRHTDTIFEASLYNKSATLPRESPDGRYLLFTLGNFGNFHIWHKSSDLYLLDMKDWSLRAMTELNSPDVESYHSWSSNGRWIIFSTRRDDGSYTRPYIAYFDRNGKAHKPFILPQKDPDFYTDFFQSFNIPEFTSVPVTVSRKELLRAIREEALPVTYRNTENKKPVRKETEENFYE
ncbi:MAG: hypothetical protein LUG18_02810 [Candidatus Azobacteroides sp.]|nr:hypothetical protein [Candidatus Azobacteroides sp.]